jgi:hypothetical protein
MLQNARMRMPHTRIPHTETMLCGAAWWGSNQMDLTADTDSGCINHKVEYMTAAWLTKKVLWDRKLMATLTEAMQAVELVCDNLGAIDLMRNSTNH